MQEINGKINEVSSQFAELNKKLREVTDGPEQNQLIEEALQSADGLETSIEELLAMLPEPPPSPNSSGSSSSSSEEPPRNIDESTPQQSLPEQQGQSPNDQEHPDGQGANQQPP
ncbi:MAG: hypothetical protein QGF46_03480, partial [Planctomycetota bacterium]|nr:hypothetical protein [Planctomycetota bacterium]